MLPVALWRLLIGIAAVGLACGGGDDSTVSVDEKTMDERLVFREAAGRELTIDDLEDISGKGKVGLEVVGAGVIPAEASRLHEEARAAGERGDYTHALDLLEQAHGLAPDWPYPVYDKAFTYLLQGDSNKAEEHYAEVDRMAPRGFFTAKTSLDCLRREHAGFLPPGFCNSFATLEWMDDKVEKRALLEGIVEKFPAFPAAWQQLSSLLDDDAARLEAITRGLEHDPDGETKGMLLLNRALVLHQRGEVEEAVKILGELALDPGSTRATELLAKATLARILR